MLDAELLRTFTAICDTGSFTAAGNLVGRTQSAVSMQVKRLEETLDCRLIGRNAHGLKLTARGELLLEHARRILRAHHEALSAFNREIIEGLVVLGIPDDYANSLLPSILGDFASLYPQATIDVVGDSSKMLLERLTDGRLDLAFLTSEEGPGEGRVVHREAYVWATAAKGEAHLKEPLPLAVYTDSCAYCTRAVQSLSEAGRANGIAYKSFSLAGTQAAVRAGLAVGLFPRSALTEGMRLLREADGVPALSPIEVRLRRSPVKEGPLLDQLEAFLVERLQARLPG